MGRKQTLLHLFPDQPAVCHAPISPRSKLLLAFLPWGSGDMPKGVTDFASCVTCNTRQLHGYKSPFLTHNADTLLYDCRSQFCHLESQNLDLSLFYTRTLECSLVFIISIVQTILSAPSTLYPWAPYPIPSLPWLYYLQTVPLRNVSSDRL